MGKQLILGFLLVMGLTSCATFDMSFQYDYKTDPSSKYSDNLGELKITKVEPRRLDFTFKNKAKSSAKILWDESALIDTAGNSHRILHNGVKYIDASRSMPPSVVPAGGLFQDSVVYADGVELIGTTWIEQEIVPCSTSGQICDPTPNYGKSLTLLLATEIDGKKGEYQAKLVLRKKTEESAKK